MAHFVEEVDGDDAVEDGQGGGQVGRGIPGVKARGERVAGAVEGGRVGEVVQRFLL